MNRRLCVLVVAVVVAVSLSATCAEEIETTPEEVRELLKAVNRRMVDEPDDAEAGLADAVERYRKLEDDDKAQVDTAVAFVTFLLAETLMQNPDDPNANARALRWFETYAQLNLYAFEHPGLHTCDPFYRHKQDHAGVLGMALAECKYDAYEVRKKYPSIAESWAPLLAADLDGDGRKEFVSGSIDPLHPANVNVFFPKKNGGLRCVTFENDEPLTSISVTDGDEDGKDEIVLQYGPYEDTPVYEFAKSASVTIKAWRKAVVTVKYEDGKLVGAGRKVVDCKPPPKEQAH